MLMESAVFRGITRRRVAARSEGYVCTPNGVNVFERGITLPGCTELRLAVTTPCRLQLCTVLTEIS